MVVQTINPSTQRVDRVRASTRWLERSGYQFSKNIPEWAIAIRVSYAS